MLGWPKEISSDLRARVEEVPGHRSRPTQYKATRGAGHRGRDRRSENRDDRGNLPQGASHGHRPAVENGARRPTGSSDRPNQGGA